MAAQAQPGASARGDGGASDHDVTIDHRQAGTEAGGTGGATIAGETQCTVFDAGRTSVIGIDILSGGTACGAPAITIKSAGPTARSTLGIGGARTCCAGRVTVETPLPVAIESAVTQTSGLGGIVGAVRVTHHALSSNQIIAT